MGIPSPRPRSLSMIVVMVALSHAEADPSPFAPPGSLLSSGPCRRSSAAAGAPPWHTPGAPLLAHPRYSALAHPRCAALAHLRGLSGGALPWVHPHAHAARALPGYTRGGPAGGQGRLSGGRGVLAGQEGLNASREGLAVAVGAGALVGHPEHRPQGPLGPPHACLRAAAAAAAAAGGGGCAAGMPPAAPEGIPRRARRQRLGPGLRCPRRVSPVCRCYPKPLQSGAASWCRAGCVPSLRRWCTHGCRCCGCG